MLAETPIEPGEMKLFSLSVCLVGAAILSMVVGQAHAVPLTLGAAVGVFGPRLIEKYKASRAPDYDS